MRSRPAASPAYRDRLERSPSIGGSVSSDPLHSSPAGAARRSRARRLRFPLVAVLCVALSAPAGAELTVRQRDIATYAALTLADATLTYVAVERGYREANPLMRLAGDDAWQVAGSVLVVSGIVGWAMNKRARHRGHDHRAWNTANLTRSFAVAWDAYQLERGEP